MMVAMVMHWIRRAAFASIIGASILSWGASHVAAQTVATANWFERMAGDGVKWRHCQFDDLYGAKQSVSVIEADLNNPNVSVEIPYLPSGLQKTSALTPAQFPGAAAAVNGSFFSASGCTTYLRINNGVIEPQQASGWTTEGGMGIRATGVTEIIKRPTNGWSANTAHSDLVANGPIVIFNDVIPDFTPAGDHCSDRHPRTLVGRTPDNKLLLVTVDGRTDGSTGMTCDEMATLMRDLGCDDAISLDGGGSTTMWVRGENDSGVVSYPSDNGVYDHLGERSCANTIAIIAPPAPAAAWDARLESADCMQIMEPETMQTVSLTYKNIGTQSWTPSSVTLRPVRPEGRQSPFATGSYWPAYDTAARLPVASVAPGESVTFSFVMTAPPDDGTPTYYEHFGLFHDSLGSFGPADDDPRLKISMPPADIIVDSGSAIISGANWSTGTSASDKYGADYRFKTQGTGAESVSFRPNFPGEGDFEIYEWHPQGANRTAAAPHTIISTSGTEVLSVNQQTAGGQWNLLATRPFIAGLSGRVQIKDNIPETSKVVMADAMKYRFVPGPAQPPLPPPTPPNIIVDNTNAIFTGTWTTGTSSADKHGSDYRWA